MAQLDEQLYRFLEKFSPASLSAREFFEAQFDAGLAEERIGTAVARANDMQVHRLKYMGLEAVA